jgi:hypothetical protein
MPNVPGMHNIKYAMAHDCAPLTRYRADNFSNFSRRFDFVPVAVHQ